jgi:tetratricopeptide (TPR) repeat protein
MDSREPSEKRGLEKLGMLRTPSRLLALAAVFALGAVQPSWAKDLKITIPRHSELTPVQRLNRDGVEAVQKKQYEKAEALFLKAYLYDPSDPFTLNNLGYISELQGELDRALPPSIEATQSSWRASQLKMR